MQNPLREENPVVGSAPAPNSRSAKKAAKQRSAAAAKLNAAVVQPPPPPPPEDPVPGNSNGVDFDDEEEPSEVKRCPPVKAVIET